MSDLADLELWFRAGALCLSAEPHRGSAPWPCTRCLMEARRQLSAPALASVTGGPPASSGALANGAAGPKGPPPQPAGGSTSATNNPQEGQLLGAERATELAREQV